MYYYAYPYIPAPMYYGKYDLDQGTTGQNSLVLEALVKGMEGESEAVDFYEWLVKMSPNKMARDAVQLALEDERIDLELSSGKIQNIDVRKSRFLILKKVFDLLMRKNWKLMKPIVMIIYQHRI